jgi:aminoglycoside phosphotransferase (APT) family kinase protein
MTTTLDDAAVRARLAAEIAPKIGADDLVIGAAERLSGGAVQENWRLDVDVRGGPRAGRHTWVLRTDARARLPVSLDRETEAKVLSAAHRSGVLVAAPITSANATSALGQAYVVQTWLQGTAQARRIVRDPALPRFGEELARALATELAKIHAIRPPNADLTSLPVPMRAPARAEVARLSAALARSPEPRPALEYILAWLDAHAPPAAPLALVHGDFRTGNYMVADGRLTGVLDWEFAHWGDPDEDIGWIAAKCWRFGNDALEIGGIARREVFLDAYAAASGRRPSGEAVRYWQIMAAAKWATIAVLQGDRFRTGGEARLELALTGLMPAEMEHDALADILAWHDTGKGGPTWL